MLYLGTGKLDLRKVRELAAQLTSQKVEADAKMF